MNAYELADACNGSKPWLADEDVMMQSATMLRQQADRIAELEKDLHMIQRHYDQLDTRPSKQLSDERIKEIIRKHWNKEYGNRNMTTFARAVIKEMNK